jgi:nitrite reductase/ring-hydroxylating ferredoxin subunit
MATLTGQPTTIDATIKVCSVEELEHDRVRVVAASGRSVAVFIDEGRVYGVDNRCPHMGFPLAQGTVKDGILTCHWHHAKFDLAGGCTFDLFADDVTSFRAEIRDGDVWLDPTPLEEDPRTHWLRKVDEGLEHDVPLVLAKAMIGLEDGDTREVLTKAALFGVRNRDDGWSDGLSILTAMSNILPSLDPDDRPIALFHALVHVARATAGQSVNFDLLPLDTDETRPERYVEWTRRFVEVRASEPTERALATMIDIGVPEASVGDAIFGASTDHLFMDIGHTLDFSNKAFELLDHIGWDQADEVLTSLVPNLVTAQRMEETSSWQHPVNLPELLSGLYERLDELIEVGGGTLSEWDGHATLADQILDGEPTDTLGVMAELVRSGVPLQDMSASVAYAAGMRLVHFRVTNEFADWNTVHHTFTYTNAVDQTMRRAPSNPLARGIFDGAMSVYLERFLNVPKQAIPRPSGDTPSREAVLETFDVQGGVDETAQLVADMLVTGDRDAVIRLLGHALLREDAGFHSFQVYEAGVRQYGNFVGTPEGDNILIGVSRFLSAHSPTVRQRGQTFEIAARLHRGESLAGE